MCDPIMVATVASSAANVQASYNAAKANNIAAEYNAKIMEQNAKLARDKADLASQKGEAEERRHRLKISKLKGQQRAGFASSGVLVDSGSALDALIDTVQTEELDALQIRQNTAVEVWQNESSAVNFQNQATLSRSRKQSTFLAAFGAAAQSGPSVLGAAKAGG